MSSSFVGVSPSVRLPGLRPEVGRIGLGAMPLSVVGRPDRAAAKAVVRAAVEQGIGLIDTADVYGLDGGDLGHNERLIAEALREAGAPIGDEGPDAVIVATKGGMTRPGGAWGRDGRPDHLRRACHASLAALGVERVPLYQLHTPDPSVPFTESIGALARLREEGKISAVGLSNVDVRQIRAAQAIVPVASVQNRLSPWDLGLRRSPVVTHCAREGIAFLAYSPLGGARRVTDLTASEALRSIGCDVGATPAELTLAWVLRQAPIVIAIPGARHPHRVSSSLRAASLELDERTLARIGRAFRTLPGAEGPLRHLVSRVARLFRR